jgi:hypothetical protein
MRTSSVFSVLIPTSCKMKFDFFTVILSEREEKDLRMSNFR